MAVEKIKIRVQVHPNARQNEVNGEQEGVWHLKIAAPPAQGRANRELIDFLSEVFKIAKSNFEIEKGLTAKQKLIVITGLTRDKVKARLNAVIKGG